MAFLSTIADVNQFFIWTKANPALVTSILTAPPPPGHPPASLAEVAKHYAASLDPTGATTPAKAQLLPRSESQLKRVSNATFLTSLGGAAATADWAFAMTASVLGCRPDYSDRFAGTYRSDEQIQLAIFTALKIPSYRVKPQLLSIESYMDNFMNDLITMA